MCQQLRNDARADPLRQHISCEGVSQQIQIQRSEGFASLHTAKLLTQTPGESPPLTLCGAAGRLYAASQQRRRSQRREASDARFESAAVRRFMLRYSPLAPRHVVFRSGDSHRIARVTPRVVEVDQQIADKQLHSATPHGELRSAEYPLLVETRRDAEFQRREGILRFAWQQLLLHCPSPREGPDRATLRRVL